MAISAMLAARAGVASATVGASCQLGAVLGVAVLGSLTATRRAALGCSGYLSLRSGPGHAELPEAAG